MTFFEEERVKKINNAGRKFNAGKNNITNYQLVTEIPDKRELYIKK